MIPSFLQTAPRWCLVVLFSLTAMGGASESVLAQRPSPSPERAFASAVQLYEQHLYRDALSAFEDFRTTYPAHPHTPQALYLEARAALSSGQDAEAIRLFDQLQENHPSHPRSREAKLSLAQYFLDQGNTQQAQRQLREIANDPSNRSQGARALYLLGQSARDQDNLEEALSYYQRVYDEHPETEVAPAALYAAGETQLRMERYDQAASSFEALGEQFPDSPFAHNLGTALAEVYYRLERYQEAAAELENRLSQLQGEERARAHFLLGEAYNQLGQGEDAVVHYRRVLDEHSGSPYVTPAQYGLAWHYYSTDRYEQAATAFNRARQNGEGALATSATYYAAVSRGLLGDADRAIQLYETFLDRQPEGRLASEARYEIGLLNYKQEQYNAAAASFRSLIRNYPDAPRRGDAHYWLGNAYLAQQNLDQALQAYNQATKRDAAPDSLRIEVQFQKAWALYENGQYGRAAPAFMSLAENQPEARRGQAALFWGADSYYQQGRLNEARSLFQRYLNDYSDGEHRPGAQYALAWTHFKQRRFDASARLFRQFLDTYDAPSTNIPYRQDARLRLADSYFALKQYEEAVTEYRRAEESGEEYALYQTGRALHYANRHEEAIRTLRRFTQRYRQSNWRPDALSRIGDIHFQQQNYEDARDAYRQLIEEYSNHELAASAQYGIGDSYYNAGQMEEAVDAYRAVLANFPQSPSADEAASSLFFALNATDQPERAEELITSIVEANPETENLEDQLRFYRAEATYQSGDSERALRLFREFVRTSSTSSLLPESYYYLGILHADQENYEEAQNYLEQLVEQYPESDRHPEGALRLGDIYLEQEEYESAVSAYESAAESDQISDELRAQALYGQSRALLQLGRTDEAETLLTRILEAERAGPLQASARLGLARLHEEEDRPDEALELYRSVAQSTDNETGAEALYRLGRLLRVQDQPRDAIQELDRMSSLFAGYPEWVARALLEQARAYRDMGQQGQAVQLYDEVLNTYAGTPFAQTAQEEKQAL